MFNRIKNWFEARLVKRSAEKTISTLTLSTAPQTPIFQILPAGSDNALVFTGDSGEDIFVHYSAIEGSGFRVLEEGDRVEFVVGEGRQGPAAQSVRRITEAEATGTDESPSESN